MPTNVRTEWKSGGWEGSGPIRHVWHDGLTGLHGEQRPRSYRIRRVGTAKGWEAGGSKRRVENITKGQALNSNWKTLRVLVNE